MRTSAASGRPHRRYEVSFKTALESHDVAALARVYPKLGARDKDIAVTALREWLRTDRHGSNLKKASNYKPFTHEHDGWPRHPIAVKDHTKYFQEHGQVQTPQPTGYQVPYADALPDEDDPLGLPPRRPGESVVMFLLRLGRGGRGTISDMEAVLDDLDDNDLLEAAHSLHEPEFLNHVERDEVREVMDALLYEINHRQLFEDTWDKTLKTQERKIEQGHYWSIAQRAEQKMYVTNVLAPALNASLGEGHIDSDEFVDGVVEWFNGGHNNEGQPLTSRIQVMREGEKFTVLSSMGAETMSLWKFLAYAQDHGFRMLPGTEMGALEQFTAELIGSQYVGRADSPEILSRLAYMLSQTQETENTSSLAEAASSLLIASWANSASDSNRVSLALQRAVAGAFQDKAEGIDNWDESFANKTAAIDAAELYKKYQRTLTDFVTTMYDHTQSYLEDHHIHELILTRGMGWQRANRPEWYGEIQQQHPNILTRLEDTFVDQARVKLNPLSSFSTDYRTAVESFAQDDERLVVVARVPADRVISTFMTGFGCASEDEVVVLGGKLDAVVLGGEHIPVDPSNAATMSAIQGLQLEERPPLPLDEEFYDWPKRTDDHVLSAQTDTNDNITRGDSNHKPDFKVGAQTVKVDKAGWTHEHDGYPRHPVNVKYHNDYFNRKAKEAHARGVADQWAGIQHRHAQDVTDRRENEERRRQGSRTSSSPSARVLSGKTPSPNEYHNVQSFAAAGLRGGIRLDKTSVIECEPGVLPHVEGLSDTRLIGKRDTGESETEYTVYKLFELVHPGFCPEVLLDDDNNGHAMRWVDDAGYGGTAATLSQGSHGVGAPIGPDGLNEKQARDAGIIQVMDWLTGNPDRHSGNVMVDGDRLWPIDHGLCGLRYDDMQDRPYVEYVWRDRLHDPKARRAFEWSVLDTLDAITKHATDIVETVETRSGLRQGSVTDVQREAQAKRAAALAERINSMKTTIKDKKNWPGYGG
jgi:hypothetical protein